MSGTPQEDRAARLERAIAARRAAGRSRAGDIAPRPADEPPRLGPLQRGLWFVHHLQPRSPAYNVCSAFRGVGVLDSGALERAFQAVCGRHRILRSSFRGEPGGARQVVHEDAAMALERFHAAPGEGLRTATAEAAHPFDLDAGPLVRLIAVEEPPDAGCYLALVLHHIVADERSLGVVWREIAAEYNGQAAGLAAPAAQYDDYVHWLRQHGRDGQDKDLAFWRRRLDPPPEPLTLPFEQPRPAPGPTDWAGRLIDGAPSPERQRDVRRLAASLGTTPFVVSAFAFRLLLQRYIGDRHVAFGTPVSLRAHPGTARMVGYFLNPVVVSGILDEGLRVDAAIAGFGRDLTEALSHASLPFDALAAALSPDRSSDRQPVFQIMFVYQEAEPAPALGALRLEPVTLDLGAAKFDLTVFVTERGGSLQTAVEYRTERFEARSMTRLLDHYERLLDGLAANPAGALEEVPILGAEEAAALDTWADGPAVSMPDPPLVTAFVADYARRQPGVPAVVCGGARQNYASLDASASAVARTLIAVGVRPADRVAIVLDRSTALIAGILGTLLAGAAYVPVDPAYPAARNADVLGDAAVAAVLTTRTLRDRLPAGPWRVVLVDAPVVAPPADAPWPAPTPDDCAYLLYTSGSTGRPKGVVVTHDNLRRSTRARLDYYGEAPERFLLLPSVAFDSSVAGIFGTLAAGGTLIVPTDAEARDVRALARLVEEAEVTSLLCVPSLYAQLLAHGAHRLRRLHHAIVAGEACPPRLVREHFAALPDTRLFNEYGPTEATVWATAHELRPDESEGPIPIGRPIPGVRVEVLDGRGRPVPWGVPGQGWIAGATVARGYWQRDDLTAEQFQPAAAGGATPRRYRTGDTLAWTDEGQLLFLGRDDDQIKLRGYRIEPGEIEAALVATCGAVEAAVVARGHNGAQLVAFVVAARTGMAADWRRGLAGRLPDHMIPARLVELPALPRLPNEKVDRRALAEMPLADAAPTAATNVPDTREQALLALWESLLGRYDIGPDDNFFELGGHSLLVVQMALAIERDFEISLPAAEIFQAPTVRTLAQRIAREGGAAAHPYEHLFPIQPEGAGAPLVMAVPDFFTAALAARFRGERPVYGIRGVSLRAEGNRGRWPTLTYLAEDVADELQRRFPGGPYVIAGYSFGGWLAFATVRVLEGRGADVRQLITIAPMPVDFHRAGPFRVRIEGLQRPLAEVPTAARMRLFLRSNHPLTNGPYRRARQWLTERPWRRLLSLTAAVRRRAGLPVPLHLLQADVRVERFRLHASYRPAPIRTPVTFFNPVGPPTDSAATWRPFFTGPLTVHRIADPHDDASVATARRQVLDVIGDLEL